MHHSQIHHAQGGFAISHDNLHRIMMPLGVAALLALLALAHLWEGPASPDLLSRALQNSLHLPAFALLGWFVAVGFKRVRSATIFLICFGVAIILESAQMFTQRDASLSDLALDGAGIVLGLLMARGQGATRWVGVGVLAIATVWSPVQVWHSKSQHREAFPVLLDSRLMNSRLLERSGSVERTDSNGLRVCLWDIAYPGILVHEAPPRWDGYETLVMKFEVEGSASLPMTLAIGYQGKPGTSASVTDLFPPGAHVWEIPVSVLQAEGETIENFKVHSSQKFAGQCFVLASVALR